MADQPLPEPATLLKLLRYNPETGLLFWRVRDSSMFSQSGHGGAAGQAARWNGRHAGLPAGFPRKDGYVGLNILIPGSRYRALAHRVAWCIFYGTWPENQIDHINGDRADNRIANLRLSSAIANARNQCLHRANTSGICGVYYDKSVGKWSAQIIVSHKRIYLGAFETKSEAAAARKIADKEYGFATGHGKPRPTETKGPKWHSRTCFTIAAVRK